MRICIFTETFHPVIGGGETQALLLASGLLRRGHRAFVLTRRSDPALAPTDVVDGIKVYRLPPAGRGQLKKWGLALTGLPALLRLRRDYDVIFVSGFRIIGIAAIVAAALLRKRVVLKADSQGEMSGEFFTAGLARYGIGSRSVVFRLFLALRNALLRRADAFAAITSDVGTELIDAGIPAASTYRIPNAVDTTRFLPVDETQKQSMRKRLDLPVHARIVAYTGRLVSYKGLPLLVDVWKEVVVAHPDALLLLIGSEGLDIHGCETQLRNTVRELKLEDSVVFTGSVSNVHEYLQAADVFAFPSENDAFPSAVIEAMTTALPVIATRVGAIPEVVIDQQTGLLIEPRDRDALLQALDVLLRDPETAARLGQSGWHAVHRRYSAEQVAEEYERVFSLVTSGT